MAIVRSSSLLSPLRHGSVNRQSLISTVYNTRTYIVIASFDNAQRLALVRFVSKFAFFFFFNSSSFFSVTFTVQEIFSKFIEAFCLAVHHDFHEYHAVTFVFECTIDSIESTHYAFAVEF